MLGEPRSFKAGFPGPANACKGVGWGGGRDIDRQTDTAGREKGWGGESRDAGMSLLTRTLTLLDQGPSLMNSFNFIKAPSPNTATLTLGLQHKNLEEGGTHKYSVHYSIFV